MDACFLFTKYLDNEGCFCLRLSENEELITAPAQRHFAEIKRLQDDCKTFIIETSIHATLLELDLPWLAERKARIAIPYALEDKLAQPVDELHFAFDKPRYHNNHYLITVISKQRLKYLMQILDHHEIEFEAITLDWFALAPQESCVSESTLLVNSPDFKGALSGELAVSYLKKHPLIPPLLFQDSQLITDDSLAKDKESSYSWIAKKILRSKPLNLCQGEMIHGNLSEWIHKGYLIAGGLCAFWLLSLLFVNYLSLNSLNTQIAKVDEQIALIYHEFFPEAKQVISPKFRISQVLGTQSKDSQSRLWFLMNQFAKVVNDNPMTIEQLRYQNKTLSVTLISTDFANLEDIENKLKQLQLNVKQTQAATRDQHVVATLELS